MIFDAWFSPPGSRVRFPTQLVDVGSGAEAFQICFPVVGPAEIRAIAAELRTGQEALQQRSVREIAEVLDAAAALWLDPDYPPRRQLIPAIAAVTGFSPAMIGHAIDLEQRSSRGPDLLRALDRELGDHRVLDGFVATPMGHTTAIGPTLVGGIFSANIPALPHLTVLRSFLVKAACLGRVSRGEPLYLAAYARSLETLDPDLARCLAVTWWPAADPETETAFISEINHIIAYGGDSALNAIRGRCPDGLPGTWHGHRMGVAVVLRGALEDRVETLADALAYDFTVFDQHACLAPQAIYVEAGGRVTTVEFARLIATAMHRWAIRLPPRTLAPADAGRLRSAREALAIREALGEHVTVVTPAADFAPTVVVEPYGPLTPSPLDRFVRIREAATQGAILDALRPVARHLQCAAVAGQDEERAPFELALARLGVTRLCPPGLMGTPSMMWAHDGMACVGRLVRWCDREERTP